MLLRDCITSQVFSHVAIGRLVVYVIVLRYLSAEIHCPLKQNQLVIGSNIC